MLKGVIHTRVMARVKAKIQDAQKHYEEERKIQAERHFEEYENLTKKQQGEQESLVDRCVDDVFKNL